MAPQRNPFEILGILPDAEVEVIGAACRALARKYYPDLNPGASAQELTRRMVDINWAREELDRDRDRWRERVLSSWPASPGRDGGGAVIDVSPSVVTLPGRAGASALLHARGLGDAGEIKASFAVDLPIRLVRAPASDGSALFELTMRDDFVSDIRESLVVSVELHAPGHVTRRVFVSIVPLDESILEQRYGQRVGVARLASANARIAFGKYRGWRFSEIAVGEPRYLEWVLREGAGSRIERESARMALEETGHRLRGRAGRLWTFLTKAPSTRSLPRRAVGESQPIPAALPDRERPAECVELFDACFRPGVRLGASRDPVLRSSGRGVAARRPAPGRQLRVGLTASRRARPCSGPARSAPTRGGGDTPLRRGRRPSSSGCPPRSVMPWR